MSIFDLDNETTTKIVKCNYEEKYNEVSRVSAYF